jgi:hypothetical protein
VLIVLLLFRDLIPFEALGHHISRLIEESVMVPYHSEIIVR